ncbi:NAD-dependent epimerase/dehydratase family protein [Draconibacterium sediminis]|uniref:Epimerase n=1 Tax=Draconibacterium sediminis TaxID=1544798 RepID=A0A0D8JBI0_9BACT|nr:NAD-dependent epimerase/dehydratase family protein [Draconibacterium sediminis]KJF43876.1 epimerase [Draconibacterium sediminis]
MDILVLGGTGAMGQYLVDLLLNKGITTTVTSRKYIKSNKPVKYIQGNAHDMNFLEKILKKKWDAIVDFMSYETYEFNERVNLFLDSTAQYIFLSSSRVYSDSDKPLTENSYRLLDVSEDKEFLSSDEYALAKARQEDILKTSGYENWTVIRPYITYSENRFQLGVFEKEEWLYRALCGRTIVFSEEMRKKKTTLTYGLDVSKGIVEIIGKEEALAETFHITAPDNNSLTWEEVLNIYLTEIENGLKYRPKVLYQNHNDFLVYRSGLTKYQIKYDRLFNRSFDNNKIKKFTNTDNFLPPEIGLSICLKSFLNNPKFKNINWRMEAKRDKLSKEKTPLHEIKTLKHKIVYLIYRYLKTK